jgi:hypothetical protein
MDDYSKKQGSEPSETDDSERFDEIVHDSAQEETKHTGSDVKVDDVEAKPVHHEIERPFDKAAVHEAFQQRIHQDTVAPAPASSGGLIILQWLTYAFWGWTLLALVWLMFIVFGSMLYDADVSSVIPYAIASTLVLLPISFICDWFYGKREPEKKTGGAMVIMAIHAVIFALFAIGSLISAVLILVQTMIATPTDPSGQMAMLLTFGASAVLYGLTFARTLNPLPKIRLHKIYPVVMTIFVTVLIVLSIVGPVGRATLTKDDRDIERYLPPVTYAIENYIDSKGELPDSLSEIDLGEGEKSLIDRGLVSYKKEDSSSTSKVDRYKDTNYGEEDYYYIFHRYQLCVTYKAEKKQAYSSSMRLSAGYNSNLYIDGHPKGAVCYKVEASSTRTLDQSSEEETSLFDSV